MPRLRHVALVPVVCVLLLAGGLPSAQGAQRALPEVVVVHDGNTSDPIVDISEVRLEASWYWDSEQAVRVKVQRLPAGSPADRLVRRQRRLDARRSLRAQAAQAAERGREAAQEGPGVPPGRRLGSRRHACVVRRIRGRAADLRPDPARPAARGHVHGPLVVPGSPQPRGHRLGLVASRGQPREGQERGHGPQPPRLEQAGGGLGPVRPLGRSVLTSAGGEGVGASGTPCTEGLRESSRSFAATRRSRRRRTPPSGTGPTGTRGRGRPRQAMFAGPGSGWWLLARMRSAARSAIMTVGAWVWPRMIRGITDASTTRSPCRPRTRS